MTLTAIHKFFCSFSVWLTSFL